MKQTQIKQNVMRRVWFVYRMRHIVNPVSAKVLACLVLAVVTASVISVRNVLMNLPTLSDIPNLAKFVLAAFANTEVVVQASVILGAVLFLLLIRDTLRHLQFGQTA